MAFHMKSRKIPRAGCNAFDKAASDNTTSYGHRYLSDDWSPIVYHLYHPERGKIRDQKTLKWWAEQEMSERTRCELGLDSPFDPNG